ncbi:DUF4238 domain-containing protein [Curtobacterium sp. MWU13-2055]|uniref:DUF4238 domain-containing protein n=1 Tax=Curtobacterium sp. MWU13-2055 TaxID=2931928 RepID=UPI002010874C|nr:DUF4238 domain-containing protein [Curtobacterium sp. MWU13-2055]
MKRIKQQQRAQLQTVLNNAASMTAARQEPRRHHLVPRFYLDQWTVAGRVQVTDLQKRRHTFTVRPEQALIETDYYRIHEGMVGGGSPVAWESWLSAVEGAAAPLLPAVCADGLEALPPEEQGQFLQFIAVQVTRSRNYRLQGRWMLGAGYYQLWELDRPGAIAAHLERNGAAATLEQVSALGAYFQRSVEDPWSAAFSPELDMYASMHAANALVRTLAERTPVTFCTETPLLTTDEPVTLLAENHGDLDSPHSGWHAAPIIAMPLGPHHVLALFRRDMPAVDKSRPLSRWDTLELNRALIGNAHRHVVSLPGNRLAARLYVPDIKPPMRVRTIRTSDGQTFRHATPLRRWSEELDAPRRPVAFWWPSVLPAAPAPPSTSEQWETERRLYYKG